jgi:hypothetical protein
MKAQQYEIKKGAHSGFQHLSLPVVLVCAAGLSVSSSWKTGLRIAGTVAAQAAGRVVAAAARGALNGRSRRQSGVRPSAVTLGARFILDKNRKIYSRPCRCSPAMT